MSRVLVAALPSLACFFFGGSVRTPPAWNLARLGRLFRTCAGTNNVITAMKEKGVSRIAVVTSIGAGDSEKQAPFFFKASRIESSRVGWGGGGYYAERIVLGGACACVHFYR